MSENENNVDVYVTTDLYLYAYLLEKGHNFSFEKKSNETGSCTSK